MAKVIPLGTLNVWDVKATLYDIDGHKLGDCMDTPNAIAKAFMEQPKATMVKGLSGCKVRSDYAGRMMDWNTAASHFRQRTG